jgi:hypothetical protein
MGLVDKITYIDIIVHERTGIIISKGYIYTIKVKLLFNIYPAPVIRGL